jgi:RNA ligase
MVSEMSLYEQLMNLNDSFYHVDHILDHQVYRIFSYRLASYTDFEQPGAKEARGIMFNITDEPYIVSRPMEKFWNLEELVNHGFQFDKINIDRIENKRDGSLISTFLHNGQILLKSKTSLNSEQAKSAQVLFDQMMKNDLLLSVYVKWWIIFGYTINFEYTSPTNQIVLKYNNPELKIINVRHNATGIYLPFDMYRSYVDELFDVSVLDETFNTREDIEGVILVMKDGSRIKLKTQTYKNKHKAKDKIMNDRGLFEAVIDGVTDDIKSIFQDSTYIISRIEEFETKYIPLFNHFVIEVECFYINNMELDRKSYAIKAKTELSEIAFPMAMNLYIGRENNYQERFKDAWKKFGLKDEYGEQND